MCDERADLILEQLRAIRSDIAKIRTELVEIKQRIGSLEGQYANLSSPVDRMAGDVALIKPRLDLVEG